MATITVTDLALDLDTDARTARKFLRSITPADEQPGKGSRWAIEKREVRSLKAKFKKFTQDAADAAAARAEVVLDPLSAPIESTHDFEEAMKVAE